MFVVFQGDLTVHDSLDLWEQAIRNVVPNGVNYLVFQQELAPTTGTLHIQGFVAMSQKKRPVPMGQLFSVQATCFDGNDGTPAQNRGYCTDNDKRAPAKQPFEHGTLPGGRGQRNDLEDAINLLKPGKGTKRLIEEKPAAYARYHGGMDKIASHYKGKRCKTADKLEVSLYVIWGTPGSGKTTWAHEFDPGNSYEMPDPVKGGTVWMPDYDGERTLIIPDYDGEYPYGTLKRMCDGTFIKFQNKGGHNYAEWDSIVITSNSHPRDWYPNQRDDTWIYNQEQGYPGPLQRRITNVCQFEGLWPDTACTIDNEALQGFPPTRAEIHALKVADGDYTPQYVAPTPPVQSYSPPSPTWDPPELPSETELDSRITEMLDKLKTTGQALTTDELDTMGANFLDDSQLDGTVYQPQPVRSMIPPGWEDTEAGEGSEEHDTHDTEPAGSIVW